MAGIDVILVLFFLKTPPTSTLNRMDIYEL